MIIKSTPKRPPGFPEIGLSSKVTFFLPSKLKSGQDISEKLRFDLIRAVMTFLLKELGGATQIEGTGFFVGEGGKVHQEKSTLCISSCTSEKLKECEGEINRLANSLAIEFEQEAIAVEADGTLYFFSPKPEYIRRYKNLKKGWKTKDIKPHGFEKYLAEAML